MEESYFARFHQERHFKSKNSESSKIVFWNSCKRWSRHLFLLSNINLPSVITFVRQLKINIYFRPGYCAAVAFKYFICFPGNLWLCPPWEYIHSVNLFLFKCKNIFLLFTNSGKNVIEQYLLKYFFIYKFQTCEARDK